MDLMKKYLVSVMFLIFSVLLFSSCNSTGPDNKDTKNITFFVWETSCTEVWLKISNVSPDASVIIQRDGKNIFILPAPVRDTIIMDENLQPGQSYLYSAILNSSNKTAGNSPAVTAKTLLPTSHNFTWQTVYFGDFVTSDLKEVAIITENNIWAVGEFYLNDSLGQREITPYNAIHWDGNKWNPIRVTVKLNYGTAVIITNADKITSIAASGDSLLWFMSFTGGVTRLNKNKWEMLDFPPQIGPSGTTKTWITKNNELYCVNSFGTIMYYNGKAWQEFVFGTTTDINDIWGITDRVTGEETMFCAVSNKYETGEQKIIKITNKTMLDSIVTGTKRDVFSIWTSNGFPMFTCGDGVFENKRGSWKEIELPKIYTNLIRGYGLNEIFICGDFGFFAHFNGLTWKVYDELKIGSGNYFSFAVKGNLVVAVGLNGVTGRAMISIGKR